jgi:hypothetical protein
LYDSAQKNPDLAYVGRGSGFFVSDDGYIFTNRHVIDLCKGYCRYTTFNKDERKEEDNMDAYSPSVLSDPSIIRINYVGRPSVIIQVYTDPGGNNYKLYYAKILVIDTANYDGAIVKIVSDIYGNAVTEKFHPVPLGNSDSIFQGQSLCLYGFPAQISGDMNAMLHDLSTIITGQHSGLYYNENSQYGLIKTDAVINSGNSGGPVFGPLGNVIGIATAAFTKTNVGLISAIDGMYSLVTLAPELQAKLINQGFGPPGHRPSNSTAIVYHQPPIPKITALTKINHAYAGNKAANSFNLELGAYYGFRHDETHTINAYDGTPTSLVNTNGGSNYKMSTYEYGASLIVESPSVVKNKRSLLTGSFRFNLESATMKYSGPNFNLYSTDPYPIAFQMIPVLQITNFSMFANVHYSYAFDKGIIVGCYIGIGLQVDGNNLFNISGVTSHGLTDSVTCELNDPVFPVVLGANIKYKFVFIDFSYRFYTENVQYWTPYVQYDSFYKTYYFAYDFGGATGKIQREEPMITIGFYHYFYGRKR